MAINTLIELHKLGQSFWYDNISRDLIHSGELKRMIDEDGLRGVTSNPTIFHKAIKGTNTYDDQLKYLFGKQDLSDKDIFFELAIQDISDAADLLMPVYEKSGGKDGFVSIEVDPTLAYNISVTVKEAEYLFSRINRKNLMIKIPATREGIIAIPQVIAKGINVNVTLLFSVKRYEEVTNAYLIGLEERAGKGEPINHINSVASFFVSRVDTLTDKLLDETVGSDDPDEDKKKAQDLMGKTAVANAKIAYQVFKSIFSSDRFLKLKEKGGTIQRILWASTSTKNPNYHDLLYVDPLIGPGSVNTMPPATLKAFKEHGTVARTIDSGLDEAYDVMRKLEELDINIDQITEDLEDEGVRLFKESFLELLSLIKEKRKG